MRPSARPPVRPSARLLHPSARPSACPPVRPPGPGPAEPIYIKLPIDRHGRLLLVIFFWTSSAAHPASTSRSARPPLFLTLVDTLLNRFWRFLGPFWRPERLWGGAGSDERNEARLHGSTNGSGGADGGSDGARPGSAGAPFGRIVEPMAGKMASKWESKVAQEKQ